eukprot:5666141-Pleurochrysis_carterae.AAC.1
MFEQADSHPHTTPPHIPCCEQILCSSVCPEQLQLAPAAICHTSKRHSALACARRALVHRSRVRVAARALSAGAGPRRRRPHRRQARHGHPPCLSEPHHAGAPGRPPLSTDTCLRCHIFSEKRPRSSCEISPKMFLEMRHVLPRLAAATRCARQVLCVSYAGSMWMTLAVDDKVMQRPELISQYYIEVSGSSVQARAARTLRVVFWFWQPSRWLFLARHRKTLSN